MEKPGRVDCLDRRKDRTRQSHARGTTRRDRHKLARDLDSTLRKVLSCDEVCGGTAARNRSQLGLVQCCELGKSAYCLVVTEVSILFGVSMKLSCHSSNIK